MLATFKHLRTTALRLLATFNLLRTAALGLLTTLNLLRTTALGLLTTLKLLGAAALSLLTTLCHHIAAFLHLLLALLASFGALERRAFHPLLTLHALWLALHALGLTLGALRRLPFGTLLLGRAFCPLGLALFLGRAVLVAPALSGGGRGNGQRRDARDQ